MNQPPLITAEPVIPPSISPTKKFNPILILAAVILLVAVGTGGIIFGKSLNTPQSFVQPTATSVPGQILTPTPDPTANWSIYINKKFGYSIKYPSNFAPEEEANYPSVWFGKQIFVVISNSDVFECRGDCPINSESKTQIIINGVLAYQGQGEQGHIGGNVPGPVLVYQFPKNSQFFQFMYQHQAKGPAVDEREIFHQMATTFKFLDQNQADGTADWQAFTSECGLTVKYPQQWKARTSFLPNAPKGGDSKYNYDCVHITAPDYVQGMDSREGFYVSINGTTVGTTSKPVDTKIIPYPINTVDDYIKSVEDSVMTEPEPFKAKNVQTKTYGIFTGKYYETAAFEEHANFVFIKGNTIYNISWPSNYTGQYKTSIDSIISSLQ